MPILLPPCVEGLIIHHKNTGDEEALKIVASYLKGRVSLAAIYDKLPDIADKIVSVLGKNDIQPFSCQLVHSKGFSSLCKSFECPFFAQNDPVNFVLSNVERIVYNPLTKELKFYFAGTNVPLVVPTKSVSANRAEIMGEINAYMLEVFGVFLPLRPYRDEDGVRRDPLQELIMLAFRQAVTRFDDEEGIDEVITHIINSNPVVPQYMASALSEAFVYVDSSGSKYLAISAKLMRATARQLLGIRSIRKLKNLLQTYGIEKRRIRLQNERAYFYLVPEKLARRLLGVELDELITENAVDIGDIFDGAVGGE